MIQVARKLQTARYKRTSQVAWNFLHLCKAFCVIRHGEYTQRQNQGYSTMRYERDIQ